MPKEVEFKLIERKFVHTVGSTVEIPRHKLLYELTPAAYAQELIHRASLSSFAKLLSMFS